MKVRPKYYAVFDNPATMVREAWIDGELRGHITAVALCSTGFRGGEWFPLYFNCGEWQPPRIWGDQHAINLAKSGAAER